MAGTISDYGGRQQIWNLGNNIIDTKEVSRFRVTSIGNEKITLYYTKQTLTNEKRVCKHEKNLEILYKCSKIYTHLKVMKRKQLYPKMVL